VEEFIDTPVKRFSSGMYVRLAFAVAAHLDADILIIDEALAVGDAAFQKKCVGKMGQVSKDGRTVLLVSHNLGFISSLTDRAIVLENGKMKFCGETTLAISSYLETGSKAGTQNIWEHGSRPTGMTPALSSAVIKDGQGQERNVFSTGQEWCLEVEYRGVQGVKLAGAGFEILTSTGILVGSWNTFMGSPPPHRIPSSGKLRFRLPGLPLCPGSYSLDIVLFIDQRDPYDKVTNALGFAVERSDPNGTGYTLTQRQGLCAFNGECEVETDDSRTGDNACNVYE